MIVILKFFYLKNFLIFLLFLEPYPWRMEVPGQGVELELQLPAYTTATATPNPGRIYNLHHGSWLCWILTLLSKAGIKPASSMDISRVHFL